MPTASSLPCIGFFNFPLQPLGRGQEVFMQSEPQRHQALTVAWESHRQRRLVALIALEASVHSQHHKHECSEEQLSCNLRNGQWDIAGLKRVLRQPSTVQQALHSPILLYSHLAKADSIHASSTSTTSRFEGSMGEPPSADPWLPWLPLRRLRKASTTSMSVTHDTPAATGKKVNVLRDTAGRTAESV